MQYKVEQVINEIVRDINDEEGLSITEKEATDIVRLQFRVLKDKLRELDVHDTSTYNTKLALNHIGLFSTNVKRINHDKDKGLLKKLNFEK